MPAFEQMNLPKEKLQLVNSHLVGFAGGKVYLIGAITLPVTAGHLIVMVNFVVVDRPQLTTPYSARMN